MEKILSLLIYLFTSLFVISTIISITQLSSPNLIEDLLSLFTNHNTPILEEDAFAPSPLEFEELIDLGSEFDPHEFQLLEKDVAVLTDRNFSEFVAKNEYVMVNFYAPWCYFSNKLAPEYAGAATILKGTTKAALAKVDCTREIELARTFKIKAYPTMYFLVGGGVRKVLYDHREDRTRNAIANWINQKISNRVRNLTAMEEAERILQTKSVIVLGFLDSLEGGESEEIDAVAKLQMEVDFYQTCNVDVAKLFHIDPHIKRPALVLLFRDGELHTHFAHEGEFTRSAINEFVSVYKTPSVITFTLKDASSIFENPLKQLWLFTPQNQTCEALSIFKETANAFKGKLLFVHVELGCEGSIGRHTASEFGVTEDAPRVVAHYSTNEGVKKHIYHGDLSLSGFKSFAEEIVESKFERETDASIKTFLRLPSSHSHASASTSLKYVY